MYRVVLQVWSSGPMNCKGACRGEVAMFTSRRCGIVGWMVQAHRIDSPIQANGGAGQGCGHTTGTGVPLRWEGALQLVIHTTHGVGRGDRDSRLNVSPWW